MSTSSFRYLLYENQTTQSIVKTELRKSYVIKISSLFTRTYSGKTIEWE